MRKILLITALPLLFLLICFSLLYAALPSLTEYAVRKTLTEYGIETEQFVISRPGFNQARIESLQLSQSTDSHQLALSLNGLNAQFDLWQLIGKQRISDLEIDEINLDLQFNSKSASDSSGVIPLLLPSEFFQQLPAPSITLKRYDINTAIKGQQLTLTGSATITDEHFMADFSSAQLAGISAQLSADRNNRLSLKLSQQQNTITSTQVDLSLHNTLKAVASSSFETAAVLDLINRPLIQKLAGDIVLPAEFEQLSGTVALNGESLFLLPLQTDKLRYNSDHHYQLDGQLSLLRPRPEIASATAQFKGDLTVKQHQLEIRLTELNGELNQLRIAGEQEISAEKVQLQTSDPLLLSGQLSPDSDPLQQLSLSPVTVTVSGSPLMAKALTDNKTLQQLTLDYQPLTLKLTQIDPVTETVSGSISAPSIELKTADLALPILSLNNKFTYKKQQLNNRFILDLSDPLLPVGGLTLTGRSKTALDKLHTTASWRASPLELKGLEKLAQRYLPDLPPELSFHQGILNHQGWLDLTDKSYALRLLNKATDTNLSYDQTRFFDIRWDSETVKSHSGRLKDKGNISIGLIDAGAPLENFSGSYQLTQSKGGQQLITLDSSTAEVLGGAITTLPVSFNPQQPEFTTAIAATQIELAKLLELEQQEGLTGSGILNGQMPIQLKGGELTISDGQINSAPEGGWIRFEPPPAFLAMTKTNPALGIAFDALRNLQYQSLGITLDYEPDGTALLKTRLQGHNPDWNNGQPVDFTINIEENIPKLIQALQFTDKLTETLEKRYR